MVPFSTVCLENLDLAARRCDDDALAARVERSNGVDMPGLRDNGQAKLLSCTQRDIPYVVAGRIAPSEKPTSIRREPGKLYPAARGVFERMEELEGIGVPEVCSRVYAPHIPRPRCNHTAIEGPCKGCDIAGLPLKDLVRFSVKVPNYRLGAQGSGDKVSAVWGECERRGLIFIIGGPLSIHCSIGSVPKDDSTIRSMSTRCPLAVRRNSKNPDVK